MDLSVELPLPVSRLIGQAREARTHAYCPYSGFAVGAALLAESGRVYTGANCENAAFGAGICAERAALAAAVTAGERHFTALAVAAGDRPVTPCGICRQMLAEFGDLTVIASGAEGEDTLIAPLSALLPHAFNGFSSDPAKH